MESLNLTENDSTTVQNFSKFNDVLITTGWIHLLLVIVPTLFIGLISLVVFISNTKKRNPVTTVYILIYIVCILGTLSYGLPMDITLITGVETLGSCLTSQTTRLFWALLSAFRWSLLCMTALLSVLQYLIVRKGAKKIKICHTVTAFLIILLITFAPAFGIHFIGPVELVKIRGSLCLHPGSSIGVALWPTLSFLLFTIPQIIVVIVFSVLTVRYIKRSFTSSRKRKIVKTVVKTVVSWTTLIVIFRITPIVLILFFVDPGDEGIRVADETTIMFTPVAYSLADLNFPFYLLFPLFIHKTVRDTVISKFKKLVPCTQSNRVAIL